MKGFSLLELIVTILIFSVIVVAIYSVLNITSTLFPTDIGLVDLQQQSRQAIGWLTRETRESVSSLLKSEADENKKITITTISSDVDSIKFTTGRKHGIHYYLDLDTNYLMREYPTGTTRIIAREITRLKFTQPDDPNNGLKKLPIVTIEVRAAKTVLKKPLTSQLNETVRIRNAD
ncbi:MAG: prepilin-type N-terminal cleavage/methylation domain-containing protein [Candidatus Omnitrophica bacterium]|nr:prepilin-type N-terminal cleavage/methylation domain-containing protein [Candidatus Omnitrophota bacterium]